MVEFSSAPVAPFIMLNKRDIDTVELMWAFSNEGIPIISMTKTNRSLIQV
jgi:hypothetical protein